MFSSFAYIASPRCSRPVGMQDGALLDVQLTASSAMPEHAAYHARPKDGGWCAQTDDIQPYIQVFLLYPYFSSSLS